MTPRMKALAVLSLVLLASFHASAAQLDVAVIRFPEPKSETALNEALAAIDLRALADSDHTKTKNPLLKGTVVFFQSLTLTPSFATATRFGALQAALAGSYKSSTLSLDITVSEGSNEGLRSFSSRTYKGSAPLTKGPPRVISLRTITQKNTVSKKGRLEIKEDSTTHAILAQIR